ncbi:Cytochrome P450 4C1 [Gryllus bimaculatus]|nr:Cytochrome P450 4C1 [Gryllus bimaculatus]
MGTSPVYPKIIGRLDGLLFPRAASLLVSALTLPLALWRWGRRRFHMIRLGAKFPGPFAMPIVGNALDPGTIDAAGDKWRSRRKRLTPAFHFKILDQFQSVILNCGNEFVRQLQKRAGGAAFDVWPLVKLLTLDVICETAMGVKMNAQINSSSKYVNAVEEISDITVKRIIQPWLHIDFIFYLSSIGRKYKKCLEVLHGTTDKGHDTTASAISFTMFALSRHQDVQEKVLEELKTVFDRSQPLEPTMQQISELKYLEMVVKESLRIYPPVPLFYRDTNQDEKLPSSQRFAMLELKSIIAKVVWNFRILPDLDFEPVMSWKLVLKTENGVRLRLEQRS